MWIQDCSKESWKWSQASLKYRPKCQSATRPSVNDNEFLMMVFFFLGGGVPNMYIVYNMFFCTVNRLYECCCPFVEDIFLHQKQLGNFKEGDSVSFGAWVLGVVSHQLGEA